MFQRIIAIASLSLFSLITTGCADQASINREHQQQAGRDAYGQIDYSQGNAEVDNITAKGKIVATPKTVGYVAFLSYTGTLMLYSTTKGKCTSSGKRILAPSTDGSADDGTFGSSDPYIYCFTPTGKMIQWNGPYMWSNAPIRFDKAPTAKSE